ncbi:MAG: carbonic anhydrase [Panacagrimonas sp.]
MISSREALQRLKDGNDRFAAGQLQTDATHYSRQLVANVDGQTPFAVVLGCSDSRVPVEIVFDQGLGDLFVIRIAGNIVAPSIIGSVEFAAERFNTRLVVVLGHSNCGAVGAAIEAVRSQSAVMSPNLNSIVDRIRPSVEHVLLGQDAAGIDQCTQAAIRANVRASVDALQRNSDTLRRLIGEGALEIVGAEYSLQTGKVDFFN